MRNVRVEKTKLREKCRDYSTDDAQYDEECSKTDLEAMDTIQDKLELGFHVDNCCEFDGYVDIGECGGTVEQVRDLS